MLNIIGEKKGKNSSRFLTIDVGRKKLATPTYFPSISSASRRMSLNRIIETLDKSGYPHLLVSCYDLYKLDQKGEKDVFNILSKYVEKDNFLFLDSGEFERYWFEDKNWDFTKYEKIIKNTVCDFFGSYDTIFTEGHKYNDVVTFTIQKTIKSFELVNDNNCVTICHGQSPEEICDLIKCISSTHQQYFGMIAVPERECGITIEDKIKTVREIRKILNSNANGGILHILGCGSPLSIALLAFAGADSFDSFDWNRWLIDQKTMLFHDFANLQLLNCVCKGCRSHELDARAQAMIHNLIFYQDFMYRLQRSIIDGHEITNFLSEHIEAKILSEIANFFND